MYSYSPTLLNEVGQYRLMSKTKTILLMSNCVICIYNWWTKHKQTFFFVYC